MAVLDGELWRYNLCRVIVVDVSDDYAALGPPLPSGCYPILAEFWMPSHGLQTVLPFSSLVQGYLYDWHETPLGESEHWTVGVVRCDLEV